VQDHGSKAIPQQYLLKSTRVSLKPNITLLNQGLSFPMENIISKSVAGMVF
jgi:hypothetical protein